MKRKNCKRSMFWLLCSVRNLFFWYPCGILYQCGYVFTFWLLDTLNLKICAVFFLLIYTFSFFSFFFRPKWPRLERAFFHPLIRTNNFKRQPFFLNVFIYVSFCIQDLILFLNFLALLLHFFILFNFLGHFFIYLSRLHKNKK